MATSRFKSTTPKIRTQDVTAPPPPMAPSQQGTWDLDSSWTEIAKTRPIQIPQPPGWGERALNYLKQGVAAFQEPAVPEFYQDFSNAQPVPGPESVSPQALAAQPAAPSPSQLPGPQTVRFGEQAVTPDILREARPPKPPAGGFVQNTRDMLKRAEGTSGEWLVRPLMSGVLGIPAGLAGLTQYLTGSEKVGKVAGGLEDLAEAWQVPDPNFGHKAISGVGSMVGFAVPAVGVARGLALVGRVAPSVAAWIIPGSAAVLEAGTEAGSSYREVLKLTKDPKAADKAASGNFLLNAAVIALTNKLGVFGEGAVGIRRALKSAIMEGGQEGIQEILQQIPAGRNITPSEIAEAAAIGALIGGGASVLTGRSQARDAGASAPDVDWNAQAPVSPVPPAAPAAPVTPSAVPPSAVQAPAETVTPPWTNISYPKVAPEVAPQSPPIPPAPPPTGLGEIGGAGQAIAENYYVTLFERASKGDTRLLKDAIPEQVVYYAVQNGIVRSPADAKEIAFRANTLIDTQGRGEITYQQMQAELKALAGNRMPPAVPGAPADLRTPTPAPVAVPPIQAPPAPVAPAVDLEGSPESLALIEFVGNLDPRYKKRGKMTPEGLALVEKTIAENPGADLETLIKAVLAPTAKFTAPPRSYPPPPPLAQPTVQPPLESAPVAEPVVPEAAAEVPVVPQPAVEQVPVTPTPRLTYEQFAKEYRDAFAAMQKYTPEQIGMNHYADKMAELADAYPEWVDQVEQEGAPAPAIAPEPVVAPEIPPVAAQEPIPAPIEAAPVAEPLPAQPGPMEPPAPVAEPAPQFKGAAGANGASRLPGGSFVEYQYGWENEDNLRRSHDASGFENPAFPQELQPADRSRASALARMRRIAQTLNPDEVADNPLLEHGAPVVGPDLVVEVGNTRSNAIKVAPPERRQAYHQFFIDNAARYGLDPEAVASDPKGQLIRRRVSPLKDRVAYVEEANTGRTAKYGAVDQAKTDARKISDALLDDLKEGSENQSSDQVISGQKEWLRQALSEIVTREEWDTVTDPTGKFTPLAVQRVKNAIFQKAYDPPGPLTSLLVETNDSGIKNILTGLLNSAPMVARADTRVRLGEVESLPIGQDLAVAAEKFAALRADPNIVLKKANAPAGQPGYTTYTDYYEAQQEMFGGLTPRQVELMRGIEERAGSAPKIKAFVSLIAEPILRAPHKDQTILFMKAPEEILYQGGNRELAVKARQHLGISTDPEDTLFIMPDGVELGGRSKDAIHGVSANEIINGVSRPDDVALRTLLLGGKFIRANGPSNYEFISVPTLDQIKVMVRNSRSVDPQRTLILEAQDPRSDHQFQILAFEEIPNPTVQNPRLQDFLLRVAKLHLEFGKLDNGEGQASAVAYNLAGDRAFAGMDPHLIKSLGANMYNRGLDYLAIKEIAIQNPSDAIMGLPPALRRLARLNVDYITGGLGRPYRIIISDQGIGMPKAIAVNQFVNVGGSIKPGEFDPGTKPAGGWGVAKLALFPNAAKIFVRTVALDEDGKYYVTILEGTGDEWADSERGLKVTHKQIPPTSQTGTTVDLTLGETGRKEPITTKNFMENFLRYHSLPFPITFQVDGKTLEVESVRPTLNQIATLDSPGATIKVFASTELHSPETFSVQILNGGMPQFTFDQYLGQDNTALYPKHVVMEIIPHGTTEQPDYPFQLNREGLRDTADRTVRGYIRETLMADAARREIEGYRKAFQTSPEIMGTVDLRLVDATQTLDPHQVTVLANDQAMTAFATASEQAYNKIHRILYGDREAFPVHGRFFGLVIANKIFGANLRARDLYPDDLTVLQPFALAAHVKKLIDNGRITPEAGARQFANSVRTTLVHEVTHDVYRTDSSADFSRALTANYDRVSLYDTEIADRFLLNLEASYGQNGAEHVLEALALHHVEIEDALAGRDSIFSAITANLATDSQAGRGAGSLDESKRGWVRSLPDLLRSGRIPARRVAPRTPVPRRGTLRPEQSDALEAALDRATFDTRLTPPGQIGQAGLIKGGKLIGWHVTDNPEIVTSQLRAGSRPDQARQGGDLGGGLYFSAIPQIWRGRGRQGVYTAIQEMPPARRQAFVDAMRSENEFTFAPGYLTDSERTYVENHLQGFLTRGDATLIGSIAGQPYNMDPERALTAIGHGFKEPATVDVEVQGRILDWGALSYEQTKSLEAASHQWLTENGYYEPKGNITTKGLAVIRQFGHERDLTNEYLRALGYDGSLRAGHIMEIGQTVVWNLDAIRRFGDWHNSRPSPGVAGEGSYYPPAPGTVRMFTGDGASFSPVLETAREQLNRRDPKARIQFVDVPQDIIAQAETAPALPPEYVAKARPLWSRTQDLSSIDPLASLDPWGSKAEDTEPFTPQRDKMRALWHQFDEGSVPFKEQGARAQAIRRETAMGITRLNPMIVGTTLTDGKAYVLIHEGSSPKEPVRLTRFDKDGLSGHEVYETPTLALVNAIRDGYLDLAPPNTMDRIMSSPAGQKSTDFQAVRDFTNELSYEHNPVWATFITLPFEVQLRSVKDPEMLSAMRAGTVPEAIARYQPPEALILTPPAMRPLVKPAAKQTELFPASAVARQMPTERLRPTRPQAQGDLLANLRPPVTNAPDIFEPRPPQPKRTDPGVELESFLGVPRMSRAQREALVKSLRGLFYGEGRSFSGTNAKEQAMTPGERMEHSRKRFYFARFSTEGFLQALGSPAAMEMRNAAINAQADEYGWNADMWRGMDALQKKYKANLPEIETALRDITKPVPGHIREAVDAFLRIIHPDTGIIPVTTRDMGILGYTGEGGHAGGPRAFSPRRVDLMPRVYKDGYLEKVMTPGTKARAEAIAYVLETGQVRPLDPADGERMAAEQLDKALAKHIAEKQSGGGARDSWAPGLTEAREIDLPDYIHNPFLALAVRVGQASRKWAVRKQFGKGFVNVFGDQDAGTAGWLDQIQDTHGEMARAATEYLFDIAYGGHYDGGMTGKVLGAIRNYESMTKLPLAILPNMGQNTLAGIEVGIRPWMQAVFERSGVLGPARRRLALKAGADAGVLFRQSLRDMETQAGMMAASPLARMTGTVLRSWSWSESMVNRSIAPRAAIIALERMDAKLRRGGQLSRSDMGVLRQIGMTPESVQQAGQVTPEEIRRGAWRVTDNTQFFERPTAIPGLFDPRGPLGELGPFIFQWKSFSVRLQRWMWHGALKEAGRGNWAPIARFALVAPMIGELIALGRSILGNREREGLDEVAKKLWEKPGFDTGWDLTWHLLKNSTEAYGLGMTAQILDSFGYGSAAPIKAFVGPGASQGYGLISGLVRGGQLAKAAYGGTPADADALAKWYREAKRAALKEVPIIGRPLGSRPMVFSEAELLNRMASDEQKALSQAAGYRAQSLRSQGSDVDYYLKKELKAIEEINRKYQNVEGRIPLTGPSRDAIKSNLERIDQDAATRARQHAPKRLRGAYPDKMSQVPQPPTTFIQMAASAEQAALKDHLAGLPPDRQRQMRAMMAFLHAQRNA